MARELLARPDIELHLALSRQSEQFAATAALGAPLVAIDTYHGAASFAAGLLRLPGIARRLADHVRRHHIGVALCAMAHPWNPLLVPSLKRAGAVNTLVVHDALAHQGESNWIHRRRIAVDIAQADAVIALSEAVRRQLIDGIGLPAGRVGLSWHPPFRHGERLTRSLGAAPFRLLFFGRLLPYKGLDQLLEAMAALGPLAMLRIVGQGPWQPAVAVPGNVSIERGWVEDSAIAPLFAWAHLLVVPYQEASQSGVISIARHAALPAVVTPVGGLVEQVEDGRSGFVAAGTDAMAIARAIAAALADTAAYARIAAALMADDSDAAWRRAADGVVADLRGFTGR
jgi:glycosyltransferase involved in cell wall biosynthesis